MRVGISGLNPVLTTEKPKELNINNCTEEQIHEYLLELEKWYEKNPGVYFSASWYNWRPIHVLTDSVGKLYNLNIDTTGWENATGKGVPDSNLCIQLAQGIDKVMFNNHKSKLIEDTDTLYLCIGIWIDQNGQLLDAEDKEELDKEYPVGTMLYSKLIRSNGSIVESAHHVTKKKLTDWVKFLKNCGGFIIY